MSFGKPSTGEASWTSQKAGALTQQIGKDERMARRALDAKLAKLEAEEGEVSARRWWACCFPGRVSEGAASVDSRTHLLVSAVAAAAAAAGEACCS